MKKVFATLSALCLCASANAYEEETHEEFTEATVNQPVGWVSTA